ncbi:sensor histidine kinase [Catenuloplanes indicus]|uniref:histidine kinase n=1 Tax=Catenuloplanes indicus TaxID=137267 RepID=A0AAE3VV51_9ACTN|nr:ATP-binding protein [Catenuloplanes indicus]MDQ0364813.1 signal transduction histidine kinase [Catenuloplanes indicus]
MRADPVSPLLRLARRLVPPRGRAADAGSGAATDPATDPGARPAADPGDRSMEAGPPGEMLVLRALCHELRPPVTMLGSLLRALDREDGADDGDDVGRETGHRRAATAGPGRSGPVHRPGDGPEAGTGPDPRAGDDRRALARLAVAHTRHLDELLRHAAAIVEGLSEPPDDTTTAALGRIVPAVAATVPDGRLSVRVSASAARTRVHPRHTRQILTNLLGNAVRHGPADGRITLHARTRGRSLLLIVCDEGSPTPELARALRRDAPPAGMHGLGLWLVRQLAQRHGGRAFARRTVPAGVAVGVLLPRPGGLSRRGHRLAR